MRLHGARDIGEEAEELSRSRRRRASGDRGAARRRATLRRRGVWSPCGGRVALRADVGRRAAHRGAARGRATGRRAVAAERLPRDPVIERAEEFAHREHALARDRLEGAGRHHDAALLARRAQDRDACLVLRRRDVHDEAAGEPLDEPFVHVADLGRQPVARADDLSPLRLHARELLQQLGLHLAPTGEELDVVEQEQVGMAEPSTEGLRLPRRDGRVELLRELVERERQDLGVGLHLEQQLPRGGEQMRLAEPRGAVHEERVVDRARRLRHRARGRGREAVPRPNDQPVEGQSRIETHVSALATRCSAAGAPALRSRATSRRRPDRATRRRRTMERPGS